MTVGKGRGFIERLRELSDRIAASNYPNEVAVHDLEQLASIPRRKYTTRDAFLGIPVIVDEELPAGTIELRRNGEVIARYDGMAK